MANSPGSDATGVRSRDARGEWLSTNRDAARILDIYIQKAQELFAKRAQDAGLDLTGELKNSFRAFAAEEAGDYVEARITMSPLADYEKDKSSEHDSKAGKAEESNQELAIHLSDTVDYYIIRRMKTGVARANEDFEIQFM